MGWGGPWSSLLRRLMIPQDAGVTDPRIVIATDDPLAEGIFDAAISWYWDDMRGFITGVERSGDGPTAIGQWRLSAYAEGVGYSQFIDANYDPNDPLGDQIRIRGGSRDPSGDNAGITITGNEVSLGSSFSSDSGDMDVSAFGRSLPRGRHVVEYDNAPLNGIGAVSTAVLTLPSTTYYAGRAYEARMYGGIRGSVANMAGDFRLRKMPAGPQIGEWYRYFAHTSAIVYEAHGTGMFFKVGAANVTCEIALMLAAFGAGTVDHFGNANSPRLLEVVDVGAASDFPDAFVLT